MKFKNLFKIKQVYFNRVLMKQIYRENPKQLKKAVQCCDKPSENTIDNLRTCRKEIIIQSKNSHIRKSKSRGIREAYQQNQFKGITGQDSFQPI